jgi:hypothetical protein
MKKFTKVNENYISELLKNKINNKSKLYLTIKCDFCDYIDEYECKNMVVDKEEQWLSTESFIQNGWNELIIPETTGIACPQCVNKWKNGDWYKK